MINRYLDVVIEQLENGIKYKKCWKCGCQQGFVRSVEKHISQLTEEDGKVIAPLLGKSKQTFEPVAYDCLGCKVCFPAIATNALLEGYPGLSLEEEDRGPTVTAAGERAGWPPLPGNYKAARFNAPVAVCTLNTKGMVNEIAEARHGGVGIVGTLNTENLGIERIIKNVVSNPNIRFLVLCGEDSEQKIGHLPGQSLMSLFQNGIDENKRIIGAQGKRPVLKNAELSHIGQFRKQVEVVSLVGCTLSSNVLQMADFCAKKNLGQFEGGAMTISVPITQAQAPKPLVLDPSGYFVIFPESRKQCIVAEHYHNDGTLSRIIEGRDVASLYMTAIDLGLLSRLDHACYFGKELARAEESLRTGQPYQQDKAQDQPGEEGASVCAGKNCC